MAFVIVLAIASVVGIAVAWPFLGPQLGLLSERLGSLLTPRQSVEFTGRFVVWELALKGILTHPVLGLGTHTVRGSGLLWGLSHDLTSHQLFLDVAHAKGLLALAMLLALVLASIRNAWYLCQSKKSDLWVQTIALGVLASLVGFLTHGLNESLFAQSNLSAMFWFLLGITIVLKREQDMGREQNDI
jgi:O-antigen ligase